MIRFDGDTTQRGVRYYLSGRVGYMRAEGNSVVALVTGSREAPYTVFLNIDHLEGSRCTCPVGLACKHLVATMAAVLEGRLKNPRIERALDSAIDTDALYEAFGMVGDLEIESEESSVAGPYPGHAPEPDDPVGEYVVELQEEVDDVRTVRTPSPAVSGFHIVEDESEAAWRVALVVGLDYSRRPTLGLVRQYRRQDGKYGRLDRIQPDEPVFLPDPDAKPLVERLEALGDEAALIAFADELIGLDLPLFEATTDRLPGAHNRPATLIRAERLELDVEPIAAPRDAFGRTLGPPNAEISLELTVRVHTGASRHTIKPRSTHGMHGVSTGMGKSLILFAGTGMVIIAESRMQLAVLARFFRYDGCASPADVASLRRIVAAAPDLLELRFPPRIRIMTVDPEPRFVLAEAGGSITMSLEAGGLPEDGYVDGEYRIHRATARVSPEAWRAGTEITGEEPLQRYRDTGWVWEFPADEGASSLTTIAFELVGQGFAVYLEDPTRGRRRVRREDRLSVTVSSGTDWFAPSVTDGRGVEIDRQQLVRMGFSGRYIDGNEIVLLDPADIDRMRRLLALVEGRADRRSSQADLATLLDMADLADNVDPDLDAMRSLAHTVLSGASAEKLEPPPGLKATLRSYQRDGYAWLAMLARHRLSGCLADDMGLGKTVQALALMLLLHEQPREETPTPGTANTVPIGPGGALLPGGFLVVAPVSTIGNWEREAARFAPDLDVLVHHGPGRSSTVDELVAHDLVLTSYATAVRDAEALESVEWRLVVLDEAQFIKNPRARTTKRLKALRSRLRLCLTGTPVENVTTDLWSIMDFLVPGLLGPLADFSRRFPKRNVTDSENGARRLERLRRIVSPFLLRRTKEAVAPELPPRIETVLSCEMDTKQARFYETLRSFHHDRVQEAIDLGDRARIGAAIFTGLLRLRQAALYPQDADPTGEGVPSAKETELLDQLEEVASEGHRAIVFSQFVSALKRMREAAAGRGIDTLYLDGQTRDRRSLIDRFQNSDTPLVFFISLKAGGTGINLTAADYVFICDPWWNPQVERQAVDRAHRIGRDRPVMVTRLVTTATVEEKVLVLQEQKRRLASDIVAENTGGIDMTDAQDLLALFERDQTTRHRP